MRGKIRQCIVMTGALLISFALVLTTGTVYATTISDINTHLEWDCSDLLLNGSGYDIVFVQNSPVFGSFEAKAILDGIEYNDIGPGPPPEPLWASASVGGVKAYAGKYTPVGEPIKLSTNTKALLGEFQYDAEAFSNIKYTIPFDVLASGILTTSVALKYNMYLETDLMGEIASGYIKFNYGIGVRASDTKLYTSNIIEIPYSVENGGDYSIIDEIITMPPMEISLDEGGEYEIAFNIQSIANTSAPVPEPATMLLLGSGIVGLAGFRRKFRGKQ